MLRGFIDSTGVEWRVWEVLPSRTESGSDLRTLSSLQATPFANGWLCFESHDEKRRLAPIPNGWESRDPTRLEELCAQATIVPARRRAQGATSLTPFA